MADAIFLSAGVPDPKRGPQYALTADTIAIGAAVSALIYVTLGRRQVIWGGQPAITPMIWVMAETLGLDYGSWVKLYQTTFFKDEFPEDNARFQNVVFTAPIKGDREKSLLAMRKKMFAENHFGAAVFIGGMGGITDEYELFIKAQPAAKILPVVSTGGATLEIPGRMQAKLSTDLSTDYDYVSLFHRHLNISPKENRYATPGEQPQNVADRMWRRADGA